MISIFTPSNNTTWLTELASTIINQTFTNWEWVILANGGASLPEDFPRDERIKNLNSTTTGSIGKLKKEAASLCSGDILVEVDHDDLLHLGCLEEIDQSIDEDHGFAYSDYAEFGDGSWDTFTYGESFGWKTYPVEFLGHKLLAHKSPDHHPRNVSEIYYAPNHVRAWSRKTYEHVGGHSGLVAGDDHDLVCRTYLVTKFVHIPKCLYFYRRRADGNNSYLKHFDLIQKQSLANRDRYFLSLAEKWADDNGFLKIDLGGGHRSPEGWVSVDLHNAQVITDLCKRFPFDDNAVGLVRAVDFLEHIPDKIHIINEIYRVLMPGGMIFSITPSTDGRGAFQDPTHCAFYNENSFFYYTQKVYNDFTPQANVRFQAARLFTNFPSDSHRQLNIPYVYADLVSLKDGFRPMGQILI